jgi:hypothetical protein
MTKLLVFFLAVGLFAQTAPWSGVLSSSRATAWSKAGVAGGIPTNRTQCGATIAPYNGSATPINNALAACGASQYVLLAPGTFHLSSGILISGRNYVTLRGSGANETFLVFSGTNQCQGVIADICVASSDVNWKGGPSNGPVAWTGGYAKGATSITLASAPHLVVGNPVILDQADDVADNGSVLVCASTTSPVCSLQGNNGGAQRAGRNQVQIVTVTSCNGVTARGAACSGTNVKVGISPGLDMPNWNASSGTPAPQAWWASNPAIGVGVEGLSVDNTASESGVMGVGISFFNALNGWVWGVRDIDSARAHVQAQYSAHITVASSYFYLTQNSQIESYGFECYTGSDNLIENNIFQGVAAPLMISGACSGTVLAYNFDIDNFYTGAPGYPNAMSHLHSAGIDHVLYEGNIGDQIYGDVFHGTHNFVTLFRNYLSGTQPACWQSGSTYQTSVFGPCTVNLTPVFLLSYSRFFNVVGNVLGQTGAQTSYSEIYGMLGSGNSSNGVTVPSDPNVAATLYRWGNYDTVTAAARFNSAEVPSKLAGSQSPYSQFLPASQALPPSFYRTTRPHWWPASKPWPSIGPDVSGGNIPEAGGHAFTNPAEDCYFNVMHGPTDGTGPVLNFSPGACY